MTQEIKKKIWKLMYENEMCENQLLTLKARMAWYLEKLDNITATKTKFNKLIEDMSSDDKIVLTIKDLLLDVNKEFRTVEQAIINCRASIHSNEYTIYNNTERIKILTKIIGENENE